MKLSPCQKNVMNTAPSSSFMEVAAVTIETLFMVVNLSMNAVTEHTCYIDDTVLEFSPPKRN